ncbi:MAG: ABC transporter permease [bacterium]
MLSDIRFRLRAIFRRDEMERELDDELRFHLEHEMEKYMASGVPRAEAARRARIALGGVEGVKEYTRDSRGIALIETLMQDFRYAMRGLRIRPGFTAAVVITLALGIGANAAMFGIVDRLMFRPPAYLVAPDRVHRVYVSYTQDGVENTENGFSYARYADFARLTTSFDHIAAVGYRTLAIGAGDDAREMNVGTVSAGFFQFFDAPPALGRYFNADEEKPPFGSPVVVLGYAFWQMEFGGRNVVGKSLRIGDGVFTIIGAAPKGFVGMTDDEGAARARISGSMPAAFVPVTAFAGPRGGGIQNYGWIWLDMVVRRKLEVSIATANADLTSAFVQSRELERAQSPKFFSTSQSRPRAEAGPLLLARGPQANSSARVAQWVMGVALIVLLIACANVTNLLLAHAVKRRREIALRLALGVSRRRLLQQLLTESLLLACLGGLVGLLVAQVSGRVITGLFLPPEDVGAVASDARTLLYVAAVTLSVAVITGLAPALHALRGDVADALKAGSREGSYRRSRIRTALLLFQGAFSVVLLVGAALFVRSLTHVRTLRLGYDITPVLVVEGVMRGSEPTTAAANALAERLVAVASTVPGVRSASLTIAVPFWSIEGRGRVFLPGVDTSRIHGRFGLQAGSPSYFATMGTRIVRGRGFGEQDGAGSSRVVVVSEGMAKALWPGKNPVGEIMRIGSDTTPFMTVVGVAEDIRMEELSGGDEYLYYLPIQQFMERFGPAYPSLFVRVADRAEDHVETLRRRLQLEMPGDSYINVVPLGAMVAPRERSWEVGAKMFVAFGGLALVLAAIGLYSVVAYGVAQRTHELGIRIALGAGLGDVMRMIVVQGVSFAVAGIAIGSAIALWAGRWVEPLLFTQSARDPVVFIAVASVLLVSAIVATLQPAFRATRVDPAVALRSD